MYKTLRFISAVGLITLFFCSAYASPSPAASPKGNNTTQESDQQISDFSLAGYGEKGKKTWDLFGKSADIFDDVVKLKNITGNLFGDKEDIKLTADRGDFNKSDGKVHLEQDVVITTSSGAKLTTDSLDWDRQKQLVTTDALVNIEKESMVTTATGARGEPNLNKMTLAKDVTVTINPEAAKKDETTGAALDQIIITCDGPLEIDYQKNIAKFSNNVKADKQDSVIYCDVMEIYFTRSSNNTPAAGDTKDTMLMGSKIDKIDCHGNVKIVRGENISYSEEAVYNGVDQKITLTGRPRLVIYSTQDFKSAFGQ